jgi:hypothetical protein
MTLGDVQAVLIVTAAISFLCYWLIPQKVQSRIDQEILWLSNLIDQFSFANFGLLEREIVFSFLNRAIGSPVWSGSFFLRVCLITAFLTLMVLSIYLFIPFSDPLNLHLVNMPMFIAIGFIVPNIVISFISTFATLALLETTRVFRNIIFYPLLVIADAIVALVCFAVSVIHLEALRDYVVAIETGRPSSGGLSTIPIFWNVLAHPSMIIDAISFTTHTLEKYTTYYLTVMSLVIAFLPVLIHMIIAAVVLISRIFHGIVKKSVAYSIFRIYELKGAFNFLARLLSIIVALIQVGRWMGFYQ